MNGFKNWSVIPARTWRIRQADEGDGWLKIPAIPIPVGELTPAEDQKEAIQPAPAKAPEAPAEEPATVLLKAEEVIEAVEAPTAEETIEEVEEPKADETVEEAKEPEVEETAEDAEQPASVRPDPDAFQRRLDSRYDELKWLYCELYHGDMAAFDYFVQMLRRCWAQRKDALRLQDQRRENDPDWYRRRDLLGMMLYTNAFAGTLKGVEEKLPYIQECGVNYLHLMPLLESPKGRSDGGYAVSNFRRVQPELGTMEDLESLADACREKDISLCLDFVMNHTSEDHEWARKARAGLPAQIAGGHHLAQQVGGAVLGVAQVDVEGLHNLQQDVQADHVRQSQGAHGVVTAAEHTLIHVLHGADVLVQDLYGLVEHGQQHTVDDEAGLILSQDGTLAHVLTDLSDDVDGLLRGAQAVDDLHQAHNGHGGEEVQASHAIRTAGGSSQAGHGDRGGVGGKDGAAVADLIQLLENSLLSLQVLVDGLDDQIHIGGHVNADGGGEAGQTGVLLLGCHFALLHQTLQALGDTGHSALQSGLALVIQDHFIAALNGGLGNTAAHQAGTDDENFADFHVDLLLYDVVVGSGSQVGASFGGNCDN